LYNLLIWAGMLQDKPKAIDPSFVIHFDEPHRYLVYPSVTQTGIVDYSKNAGEPFEQGEELAVLRTGCIPGHGIRQLLSFSFGMAWLLT